jgi:hypothetical protein
MTTMTQKETPYQIPLIHVVDVHDAILLEQENAEWYRILRGFPWERYQGFAALYYDHLYRFNVNEAKKRELQEQEPNRETRKEAVQRLLFDRASMRALAGTKPPIIYQGKVVEADKTADPESLAPGIVPERYAGRKPKCFFALFKSFLGATLMGFSPEPEMVWGGF